MKAQELALKQQQIELEKLKEINRANAAQEKRQESENSGQQQHVEACVKANEKLVGKLMGVTYQSVRDDCQAKYPTTTTDGMQTAANTTASSTDGEGGSNAGILLGLGALLVLGGSATAKKFTKSSQS